MSEEIVQVSKSTRIEEFDLQQLCELLATGHTVNSACIEVGISVRTFNRWRLLGQDPQEEQVFQDFYFQTESARMKSVNHLLDELYNQAQYDPRVAMWLIERLYPEQFSLKPEFRKTKDDIKAEEFQDQVNNIAEKGWANLIIAKRKQKSETGISHYCYEDDFKPTPQNTFNKQTEISENDDDPF